MLAQAIFCFGLAHGSNSVFWHGMVDPDNALSPPQRLALVYARKDLKAGWALLLEFDHRLMAIARKGQEVVLKQLRLAWWRDQLAKSAEQRPKGEPLLAQMATIDAQLDIAVHMQKLVDAWENGISADDEMDVHQLARLRAEAIFGGYARWTGADDALRTRATNAGVAWASADFGDAMPAFARLPTKLKPLNVLMLAASAEQANGAAARLRGAMRLHLYALTGL